MESLLQWKSHYLKQLNNEGIESIWKLIEEYIQLTTQNKFFNKKRNDQNKFWLIQTIESRLKTDFFNRTKIKEELENQLSLIEKNKTTPFAAAELLLSLK